MYTLKQIADELKIPFGNVRHYKNAYKEYYPSHHLDGDQHPKYEEQALEVTRVIVTLLKKGKKKQEIIRELSKKYSPIIEAEEEEQRNQSLSAAGKQRDIPNATIAQQHAFSAVQSTKFTHHLLREIRDQNELLEIKEKRIEALKEFEEENEEMKKEIARLRAMPFWERWRAS